MDDFCSQKGIKRVFSNARTPQQNGVAERRNKTLIEAARIMLADAKLPVTFWAEAVNTACYVQNRVLVNKSQNKTLYELFNGRTPAIGFHKPFGCHVMILNTLDNLEKFEAKGDDGYFFRYSISSKAFRVFNKITKRVEESLHVEFLENKAIEKGADPNWLFDIDSLTKSINYVPMVVAEPSSDTRLISKRVDNQVEIPSLDNILTLTNRFEDILGVTTNSIDSDGVEADVSNMEITITASPTPTLRIHKDHPKSQIIGHVDTLIQTKNRSKEVLKNKKDERGIVIRNKARLVAQRHTQEEGIDYDKVSAHVVRIEAIRLFLAYASFMRFTVYQMDVRSAFLYGTINEEVYVMQPLRFQDLEFPAKVYKVEKVMYRLHQAPRAWLSMPCEALLKEISSSILRLLCNNESKLKNLLQFLTFEALWIETMEEGTKILATVDGKLRTVFESSIRRNLKLNDEGEGSGTPTESHHTPTSEASQSSQHKLPSPSLPPVPTESLPIVILSNNTLLRQYTRRTRIAQSSVLPPVADVPAYPLGGFSQSEACPTDSGFEADQDRANIAKTFTFLSDSTPRVTSLAADEDSMQHKLDELMVLCTSLQRQQSEMVSKFEAQELEINRLKARIKPLEDKDRGVVDQYGDDAPIKGRRLDEREEAAERVSNDIEEMATVLTSMDAASILTSGGVQMVPTTAEVATATVSIPTGSGVVSTASPTIPTAALIFTTATESTPYTRRKGKEKMVESDTPKKKKLQEQIDIARDVEIARIHAEEELQMLIDGLDRNNETVAKYLQEYDQFAVELPFERRIEFISDLEEAEMFKSKGLRLEQESAKKLKTSKEVPEEVKSSEEVPEEKVKEMMQLGRIVGNKMHKAFPLPVIEFPLSEEVSTASEESSHCQKKRDVTAKKIALPMKSSSNYQSNSYDSYAKLVPHV
nr:retrovirus-related Pol polyprotein from transposon TNT 1-94 [Tanacetum cinerariifolium]